jgi:hypothetical protein
MGGNMSNQSPNVSADLGIFFKWGTKRVLIFLGSIMAVIGILMIASAYMQQNFLTPNYADYKIESPFAIAFYCLSGLLAITFMLFWIAVEQITIDDNQTIAVIVLNLIMAVLILFLWLQIGHCQNCGFGAGMGEAVFGVFLPIAILVFGNVGVRIFVANVRNSSMPSILIAMFLVTFVLMILLITLNVLDPPPVYNKFLIDLYSKA